MESLKDIISDIRVFLYGGMLTLPLTIAGTLLILGLFTANYAILFFLVGFLVFTPLVATILQFALKSVFGGYTIFKSKTSDICRLVIPYATRTDQTSIEDATSIVSPYMAMVSFFIGYIFTNALELYTRETPDLTMTVQSTSASDISSKVTTRKSQAIIAMAAIIIFTLIVFFTRAYTGCESTLGMILTMVAFAFAGNGWYKALSSVGQDRLSDLFGIANRLLPPEAITNGPIACVPIPA